MHFCDSCHISKAIIQLVAFEGKGLYYFCEECFHRLDGENTFDEEDLDCVEQET